ncbi:MAG: hypothetical protein V2A74_11560 [bacterium]
MNAALNLLQPEGFFKEGDGHDTHYQAVSIVACVDLIQADYDDSSGSLRRGLKDSATWLAARILPNGTIDSTGNSRTCGGGESFLGELKRVSPIVVFQALAYAEVGSNDPIFAGPAQRVSNWMAVHSNDEPCFPLPTE